MSGTHAMHIRPEHPDFLDLPWQLALERWPESCTRLVEVERGLSRHTVLFVEYEGRIYAIKELPGARLAASEYDLLRRLRARGLPAVEPVGHVEPVLGPLAGAPGASASDEAGEREERSLLITLFLDLSLPYRTLFISQRMERYQERLLSAMACLLVRLHLAGFFWGDCSLSNVLFKRDAGELGAYVVDAETSAMHERLSDGQRLHDLEIMEENVLGDLSDLCAEYEHLATRLDPNEIVQRIREQYLSLWQEINREVVLDRTERYRIHERIEALEQLGFSVDEVELIELGQLGKLKMRTLVTDQSYHRHHLHNLTGIVAKDHESRLMLNEIREFKATLSSTLNRSTSLSVAAFRWMNEVYLPCLVRLRNSAVPLADEPELYCQLLEHKWYLSERAGLDVGLEVTVEDFLAQFPDPASAELSPELIAPEP